MPNRPIHTNSDTFTTWWNRTKEFVRMIIVLIILFKAVTLVGLLEVWLKKLIMGG